MLCLNIFQIIFKKHNIALATIQFYSEKIVEKEPN